jgi:hypothetical protein
MPFHPQTVHRLAAERRRDLIRAAAEWRQAEPFRASARSGEARQDRRLRRRFALFGGGIT